jgi:hypothetical protein
LYLGYNGGADSGLFDSEIRLFGRTSNLNWSTINHSQTGALSISATTTMTMSLTDNLANAFQASQFTNDYINLDTTNNAERTRLGNTVQSNHVVQLRHGSSGYVTVESSTRDARMSISGNAFVLNTETDCAPQVTHLTTTQRDALTATNGMIIYNTTTTQVECYENGAWRQV